MAIDAITTFLKMNSMNMFYRFSQLAALCALLSGFSIASASADEVQDANKLFKQGQLVPALEKVDAFLIHKPKDAPARFLKGLIKAEQGNTDEAIRIFSALTVDFPELPEPYNNLAVLYAGQGQYDKAKTALESAIRTHPSYSTAHENLGDIYAKMASQAYDRALQLDRSNTSTQTKLALIKDLFSNTGKVSKTVASAAASQASAPSATTPVAAATVAASAPPVTTAALTPVQPVAAVSAVSIPATKPAASTTKPASHDEEALQAVQDWAAAWSANDVPRYLAFYAKDFKLPRHENRSNWEKQRQQRIAKPRSIQVSVTAAKVRLTNDSHATVTFRQGYRSGSLKTSTIKTLEMIKSNGKWQILEERTGK